VRQRRLHLGPRPRRRRNQSRRPPPKLHGNRKRPGKSPSRSGSSSGRASRRNQRRSHRLLRSPARRSPAQQRTAQGIDGPRSQHHRLHRPPLRRSIHQPVTKNAQRQNHAPPPPRISNEGRGNRRHHHVRRHGRNRAPTKSPSRRRGVVRGPTRGTIRRSRHLRSWLAPLATPTLATHSLGVRELAPAFADAIRMATKRPRRGLPRPLTPHHAPISRHPEPAKAGEGSLPPFSAPSVYPDAVGASLTMRQASSS